LPRMKSRRLTGFESTVRAVLPSTSSATEVLADQTAFLQEHLSVRA